MTSKTKLLLKMKKREKIAVSFLCLIRSCIFAKIKLWHYKLAARLFPAWPVNTSTSTHLSCCGDNWCTTRSRARNISCRSVILSPYGLEEDHPILPQFLHGNHAKAWNAGCGCSEGPEQVLKAFIDYILHYSLKNLIISYFVHILLP